MKLIENLNSFQTITRKEITELNKKVSHIERLVERFTSLDHCTKHNNH